MADQDLEIVNAQDNVTIRLDGNQNKITVGAADETGSLFISNPNQPDTARAQLDGRGRLMLGGAGASGQIYGFHADGKHGDVQNAATFVIDAKQGLLALGKFIAGQEKSITLRFDGENAEVIIGGEDCSGSARLLDSKQRTTIKFAAESGSIRAGGSGVDGRLVLRKNNGLSAIQANANGSVLQFHADVENSEPTLAGNTLTGPLTIELDGSEAAINLGTANNSGSLNIRAKDGRSAILADGSSAAITLGSHDNAGSVLVRNREGTNKISLKGSSGRVSAESGRFREVIAIDDSGSNLIQLDGPDATIRCGGPQRSGKVKLRSSDGGDTIDLDGSTANIKLGAVGNGGALFLRNENGQDSIVFNGNTSTASFGRPGESGQILVRNDQGNAAIMLNGETANVGIGVAGVAGNVFVKNDQGQDTIVMNGSSANVGIGGDGQAGDLFVRDHNGNNIMHLKASNGNFGIGGHGESGDVFVKDKDGNNNIHLSGESGDIILTNADCAEEFDIDMSTEHEPGTVMVIDDQGCLRCSDQRYDTRVAGVVSGAGHYKPGILLDRNGDSTSRRPIALVGKVYCKVDATITPVSVGDLLTTSATPGFAMRAADPSKSPGTVIGKALASLADAKGLVPILVALQ
jgi:hypothetical protein